MNAQDDKCVIVIDEELPVGKIANTAGILGITLGKQIPETVGPEVFDKSGKAHPGIIELPLPILRASREKIREIREKLYQPEFLGLITVDFSDVAQGCNHYADYIEEAANTDEENFFYYGIGICGAKKAVARLTGNLPLMR